MPDDEKTRRRNEINRWIRGAAGFDAVDPVRGPDRARDARARGIPGARLSGGVLLDREMGNGDRRYRPHPGARLARLLCRDRRPAWAGRDGAPRGHAGRRSGHWRAAGSGEGEGREGEGYLSDPRLRLPRQHANDGCRPRLPLHLRVALELQPVRLEGERFNGRRPVKIPGGRIELTGLERAAVDRLVAELLSVAASERSACAARTLEGPRQRRAADRV